MFHFACAATVTPVIWTDSTPAGSTLALIESAMRFSAYIWSMSQRGGELGKNGSYPDRPGHGEDWKVLKANSESSAVDRNERTQRNREQRNREQRIIAQATRILSLMFGAVDESMINQSMRKEWPAFQRDIKNYWPEEIQKAMVFHAAMVSCQLPLSAYYWARERFVPVRI
jgi:hypothetical protein